MSDEMAKAGAATKTQANEPGFVLMPCPFCGGAPKLRKLVEPYEADGQHPAGEFDAWFVISCDECGIEMAEEYHSEAAETWNRRAAAPIVPAPAYRVKAHDVIREIVDYAENIAGDAGVGSSETAGVIVSFLAQRPSLMPAFMAGTLSAVDTGMLDHHNGVLSWHGQDGGIYRPDPSKARFPSPAREPLPARTAHEALSSAPVEEADAKARPSDDQLWDQTLAERDNYHDAADKLAEAIGELLGVNVGEHSSAHSPWENALEHAGQAVRKRALSTPPASTIPSEPEAKGEAGAGPVRDAADGEAFWKRSFQTESRARIEAEARLGRLLLICRQIKWVGIGMPSAADGSTQQAFVQLAELLFADGIEAAIQKRSEFPPSTCNAWEDCKHDGVCHDPEQCGFQEERS